MTSKIWGGRFQGATDAVLEAINVSIDFDKRLGAQDIRGSLAHVAMLSDCGILSTSDAEQIKQGLLQIKSEIERGAFQFSRELEDIHMNVETRLSMLIGPVAGRLHTARSRNDQVATDFRLYIRDEIDMLDHIAVAVQRFAKVHADEHQAVGNERKLDRRQRGQNPVLYRCLLDVGQKSSPAPGAGARFALRQLHASQGQLLEP